jgi:catechol 2,3-dioxygenase-like lactoylglutathione lyase family enzyme
LKKAEGEIMSDEASAPLAKVTYQWPVLAVSNIEATAQWYNQQLGFKQVFRKERPDYGTKIMIMESDDIRIELIEDQKLQSLKRSNPPQHTRIGGVSQIAFKVKDIQTVVDRVKSRSIQISWDLQVWDYLGFKVIFIRDNEGNIVELVETFDPPGGGRRF